MTSNTAPYIKVSGVITMLENKYKRMWAIYNSEGCYYMDNGVKVPADVFEAMYPLTLEKKAVSKGDNPNGRTNWMD